MKKGDMKQKPVKLSPEEYAAIDSVPPYKPGDGIPLDEAIKRAEKRTKAWMSAHRSDDLTA